MSNYYGLNTPSRDNNLLFEQESPERHSTLQKTPYLTFTPCTRLSRMTIDSQSNGLSSRTARSNIFQLPATNFNEKLMEVVKEEEESSHPNLTMFLGDDKISIFDKKKNGHSSLFSDDEESDEGDLFSSSLCPMSSPERSPPIFSPKRQSIFDDNIEFEPVFPLSDDDQHYDPTNSWVFNIYQDDDSNDAANEQIPINNDNNTSSNEDCDEDENRAPRMWRSRKEDNVQKKKLIRSSSHEDNTTSYKRLPLQEIRLEDYTSDDEPPARKKASVTTTGNTHKIRFIRTLSPTRNAKRKGKAIAENIIPN